MILKDLIGLLFAIQVLARTKFPLEIFFIRPSSSRSVVILVTVTTSNPLRSASSSIDIAS